MTWCPDCKTVHAGRPQCAQCERPANAVVAMADDRGHIVATPLCRSHVMDIRMQAAQRGITVESRVRQTEAEVWTEIGQWARDKRAGPDGSTPDNER